VKAREIERTEDDAMAPLEVQAQVSEPRPAAPAVRSVRRATARRASARRAAARRRQRDDETSILGFLAHHPKSTIGDLARGLNLDAERVVACLTALGNAGEIQKASHGYSAATQAEKRSVAGGVIRAGG
jgi:predicted RNA-binding Zn ribbon-like protein